MRSRALTFAAFALGYPVAAAACAALAFLVALSVAIPAGDSPAPCRAEAAAWPLLAFVILPIATLPAWIALHRLGTAWWLQTLPTALPALWLLPFIARSALICAQGRPFLDYDLALPVGAGLYALGLLAPYLLGLRRLSRAAEGSGP